MPVRGGLRSSIVTRLWLTGQKYHGTGQAATVPAGDTNVDIRNDGTALSVPRCSKASPGASAFLQGDIHLCRHLVDLMQGVELARCENCQMTSVASMPIGKK